MILFKTAKETTAYIDAQKSNNLTIGYVPTMGALHEGHLKLIKECKKNADIVVVSIFVNPTQFNNKEDLIKYPRPISNDIALLEDLCDVLFLPHQEEIYPIDWDINKIYDLGTIETVLEGAFRPGHFQGVAMVLDRLFSIIHPDKVYFGQKDYQQCMVVRRLLNLNDDFKTIEFNIVNIERAASGLALSSRNARLSNEGLDTAAHLFAALSNIKKNIQKDEISQLIQETISSLQNKNIEVEYLCIADATDLTNIENWNGTQPVVALIAAYVEGVRLIDNLLLN